MAACAQACDLSRRLRHAVTSSTFRTEKLHEVVGVVQGSEMTNSHEILLVQRCSHTG